MKTTRIEIPEVVTLDLPTPPEGQTWRRKIDGLIFPYGVHLGMLYYINGKKLDEPIKETVDDFELIEI